MKYAFDLLPRAKDNLVIRTAHDIVGLFLSVHVYHHFEITIYSRSQIISDFERYPRVRYI